MNVYAVDPFIPVEAVIKVSKSKRTQKNLMIENHFLRFLRNEEFICKMLEEIVIYD